MAKPVDLAYLARLASGLAQQFKLGNRKDCVAGILEPGDPASVAIMAMFVAKALPKDDRESLIVCLDNYRQAPDA